MEKKIKKKLISFVILFLALFFIFKKYNDKNTDEVIRKKKEKYLTSYHFFKKKKFIPRKSTRREVIILEEEEEEEDNILPLEERNEFENLFLEIEEIQKDCKEYFTNLSENKKVTSIFTNKNKKSGYTPNTITNILYGLSLYSKTSRIEIIKRIDEVEGILLSYNEIDKKTYQQIKDLSKGCLFHKLKDFFASTLEISVENNWSEENKRRLIQSVVKSTLEGLEQDPYPENLKYTLEIIGALGDEINKNRDFFKEINQLHSQISVNKDLMEKNKVTSPHKQLTERKMQLKDARNDIINFIEEEF